MAKKTHITFELDTKTSIKVLHDGNHVGNIWSESECGGKPHPGGDHESVLESIQICGFAKMSEVWSCGIFHGTKDVCVRFNPMMDDFYKKYQNEYKRYIDECFKQNKPQMIKPYTDWVAHMGHPDCDEIRRSCSN